jgi:transcriptional regulator with XRE-family HTH domain
MNEPSKNSSALGPLIRQGRTAKHLSIRSLAALTDIPRSTLFDLELGQVATPHPIALQALARALDLPLTDVYAAAGYTEPEGLPSFTPYLRSKYADLPADARAELATSFERIAKKYGYDASGPAPGEDEH